MNRENVTEREWLVERFEEHRRHLRAVAYRMLGSLDEADDAVQEAWLRLSRSRRSRSPSAWRTSCSRARRCPIRPRSGRRSSASGPSGSCTRATAPPARRGSRSRRSGSPRSTRPPRSSSSGYPWLSEGLQVGDLAGRFPDVTFVATNGLQINISGLGQTDAELALADNPNLLIQTSGVYREDFIEGVARRFGPERVLSASAYPRFDPALEILRVRWASFPDAGQEAMLHGNAARVFGAPPGA